MKLGMGRNPQVDVTVTLSVLIEAIGEYFAKDEAIAFVVGSNAKADDPVNESNAVYVADFEQDEHFLHLLVVRGDPGRGNPAFVIPKSRKVTTLRSNEPGAVRGASSHIIISKKEIAGGKDAGRYRMAMEQAPGVSRVLARDLLGSLLTRFAKDHPDRFVAEKKRTKRGEKPETIEYRPTVRFHPHENASLKSDLENGKIGGFKLVRGKTEFEGEADEAKIRRLDVRLHAQIVPTDDMSKVWTLVDHIQQTLDRINFEDLKLELVDEEGKPSKVPGTISLDDAADEPDMRYCKKVKILGLPEDLTECHEALHAQSVKFIEKTLIADTHWK